MPLRRGEWDNPEVASNPDLERLIAEDLYNELRYLLVAATSWRIAKSSNPRSLPKHFIVLSMDSAFLHARSLYEFFTGDPSRDEGGGREPASWKLFGAARQKSVLYEKWGETLHARLFHLRRNRPQPTSAKRGTRGTKLPTDIKEEVVNFAHDLLALWQSFTQDPALLDYRTTLDTKRAGAIREADLTAHRYNMISEFR